MIMKLCVFQGTFNPIHKAHIKMAEYVAEHYNFDKIIFIPAYKPPHKDYDDKMSLHRYNMVKLAIKNNPAFDISDIEYKSEEKSYSYLTIKKLYEIYPVEGKIKFIIGSDAFERIESWYETDKLKEIVDFLVFIRENSFNKKKFNHLKAKGYNFEFVDMDFIDISSSKLKNLIKENKPTDDFITKEVDYYIRENGLYKN